jgi:replicative DNA helicase
MKNKFILVHGATGSGKTTFCINEANADTLFISLELSPEELYIKGLSKKVKIIHDPYVSMTAPVLMDILADETLPHNIIIDHWELIDGYRKIKPLSLKLLADTHNKTIMLVAQQNRRGEIYGSITLKQACDLEIIIECIYNNGIYYNLGKNRWNTPRKINFLREVKNDNK